MNNGGTDGLIDILIKRIEFSHGKQIEFLTKIISVLQKEVLSIQGETKRKTIELNKEIERLSKLTVTKVDRVTTQKSRELVER